MYHTNVVMAVGTDVAVVCLESVTDVAERKRLRDSLAVHHEVSPNQTCKAGDINHRSRHLKHTALILQDARCSYQRLFRPHAEASAPVYYL